MSGIATKMSRNGRVVIPAEYRRILGLREGDEVIMTLEDGAIRLTTRLAELREAQAIVSRYRKDSSCWSEELIQQRRREAEDD